MNQSLICFAWILALPVLGLTATSAGAGDAPAGAVVTSTSVKHVTYKTSKSFDAVTAAVEKQLGKFDPAALNQAFSTVPFQPGGVEAKIHAMEGTSGLMLFAARDHGQLLALKGRKVRALQYELGNPLVALQMTQVDLRAGEYAPVRMYVDVGDDGFTYIDYDLPSSFFGRFKSPQVDEVGKSLDRKLENLVANALKD